MYKKGGTITTAFTKDADNLPDTLHLDNVADFRMGTRITVFSRTATINTKVMSVSPANKTITIPDLNQDFARFDGVKLRNNNRTFSVPLNYLEMTYGDKTTGTDELNTVNTGLNTGSGPLK